MPLTSELITTKKLTMVVNTIIRPIGEDILAQQHLLNRNIQLGCPTKSGIQIDARLLVVGF